MTGAMKSVRPDAVLCVEFFWNGYPVGNRRHRLMESGVKYGYLFCGNENFFSYFNSQVVGRIVQWCEGEKFFYFILYFRRNDHGLCETFAAVHNPVTHHINFFWMPDHPDFFID